MNLDPSLVFTAIAEDDELKERIRQLAWMVVDRAEYILQHGSPALQAQTMRTIMPAIVRALQQQNEDEKYLKLKQDFEQQMKEIRQNLNIDYEIPDE